MRRFIIYIPSILFNLLEIAILFLTGYYIVGLPALHIIIPLVVFTVCRTVTHSAKHYKSPVLCAIWSGILFTTIFYVTKIDFSMGMLLTIIAALTQTGLLDVRELFMWRRDYSKYQSMQDYIDSHKNDAKLKEFELRLQKADPFIYRVYDLKFNKKLSFDKISDTLDGMDNRRIVDYLNCVLLAFNIFFENYPHYM